MKVLIDADSVLELFLNRNSFVEDVEELLFASVNIEWLELYTTNKCLKRVSLELEDMNNEFAEQSVDFVKRIFNDRIIFIDSVLKKQAREYSLPDFDSAEELACANKMNFDAIVTHNPWNFDGANLRVWSLAEFINNLLPTELSYKQSYKRLNKEVSVEVPEVGVYECEINLKFRLIEEKSLLRDREQILTVLLEALAEGSDDFIEMLQQVVKVHQTTELKASPQMRRQLMRLYNPIRTVGKTVIETE